MPIALSVRRELDWSMVASQMLAHLEAAQPDGQLVALWLLAKEGPPLVSVVAACLHALALASDPLADGGILAVLGSSYARLTVVIAAVAAAAARPANAGVPVDVVVARWLEVNAPFFAPPVHTASHRFSA